MRKIGHALITAICALTIIQIPTPVKAQGWKLASFKMGATAKYWDQVASCETGQPQNQVNWRKDGMLAGGLRIMTNGKYGDADQGTWEIYGGEQFASSPDKASKFEQILVANRIAVLGWKSPEGKRINPLGYKNWSCVRTGKLDSYWKTTYTVNLPVDETKYCPRFAKLFAKYGLPVQVFSYIAYRESRCNPGAVNAKWSNGKIVWTLNQNGTYDSGLLQINSSWFGTLNRETGHDSKDLMNPQVNAYFASWILHNTTSRLGNWSVRTW